MLQVKNIDMYEGSKVAILEDYDTSRWNDLAQRTNIASFVRMVGREPINYSEVQAWVKTLSGQNKKPTAVTVS